MIKDTGIKLVSVIPKTIPAIMIPRIAPTLPKRNCITKGIKKMIMAHTIVRVDASAGMLIEKSDIAISSIIH